MAISPPTDILLDVATAADPAKVRAATERLAKLAADPTATNEGFTKALAAASDAAAPVASAADLSPADAIGAPRAPMRTLVHGKTTAYQKFEAMMLQNFVEQMLPKSDELYGDNISSDAYRSMMAEQLANQIAKAGGIGIARVLERVHPQQGAATTTTTPTQTT